MRWLLCIFLAASAAVAEPPAVAVMPLRPLGVPADAAAALEATLRAEVARLPEVKAADAAAVRKALRKETDCLATISCAAGAASSVGADRFTVGTVSSLGEVYMLDLKLLDARTGSELRRVSRPISGAKDQLIDAVRAAAVELLAPARYAGSLYVDVFESGVRTPGAALFLDGKAVGTTPLREPIGPLAPGQHALRVEREGDAGVAAFVEIRFERVTAARIDLRDGGLVGALYLTPEAARPMIEEALRPPAPPPAVEAAPPPREPPPIAIAAPARQPRPPYLRIAGWSCLGLGAVSALVAVVFHARAYSTAADLNRLEQSNRLTPADLPRYGDVDSEVRAARILYGAGALLGVAGGAALLYDRHLDEEAQHAVRVEPLLGPRAAGLGLTGSF